MLDLVESGSYCAIRLRPSARGTEWWYAAEHAANPPAAIRAILGGRDRLEVSRDDATAILAWAAALDTVIEPRPEPVPA